ncbi:MAG: radical SAM protein [Syntrophaceae bacterium]|nr:radical SAM protein [Syntrophaceae bacterium]
MLLVHPPVSKPCEPPPGIARLAGALRAHDVPHVLLDANREGLQHLLERTLPGDSADTWTRRARSGLQKNLRLLTTAGGYENPDRYRRAVSDVNRALERSCPEGLPRVTLANYEDPVLSPLRTDDLLAAAEHPGKNPFFPYFRDRLSSLLADPGFTDVGFSLNYLSQAICTFAMIGHLRRLQPNLRILLGGGLATSWSRRPGFGVPFRGLVDEIIDGPGEARLLSRLGKSPGSLPARPYYRDLLSASDPVVGVSYLAPGPILPYSASSGCSYGKCSFCPEHAEGRPFRPIPPERAAGEIRSLATELRPVLIHLLDNTLSPALLKAIIADPPGAPWYGFVRVSRDLADPDFCTALKRSGCVMLQIGIESGSQKILDSLNKGIRLETAAKALPCLRTAGIAAYVYLLFGTPGEAEPEARETLYFTARHSESIGFLNLAVFNLPVGSAYASGLDIRPFYEGDLSLYRDFHHPRGWDRGAVRRFLQSEFRRHPAIASILRRDPPLFTSNHAPFFARALFSRNRH